MEALVGQLVEDVCQLHRAGREQATAVMGRLVVLDLEMDRLRRSSPSPEEYLAALERAVQPAALRMAALSPQLDKGIRQGGQSEVESIAFAERIVPPGAVLPWLAAATRRTIAASGAALGTGDSVETCRSLTGVIVSLLTSGCFDRHAAAVERDLALQRSLLPVLLQELRSAAVIASLPADRRPLSNFTWGGCGEVLSALASEHLQEAVLEHLMPQARAGGSNSSSSSSGGSSSRSAGSSSAGSSSRSVGSSSAGSSAGSSGSSGSTVVSISPWRTLESAAMLLAHLPEGCPEGMSENELANLWHAPCRLLGISCSLLLGSDLPDQRQRQRAVTQLRLAVLRMCQSIWASAGCLCEDGKEAMMAATAGIWKDIVGMMCSLAALPHPGINTAAASFGSAASTTPPAATMEELPAWCDAAAAMLRTLPQLGELAAQATLLPTDLQEAPLVVSAFLVYAAASIAAACDAAADPVAAACHAVADLNKPMRREGPTPAVMQAGVAGVWQLHAALCRATHWSLTAANSGASSSSSGSGGAGQPQPLLADAAFRKLLLFGLMRVANAGKGLDSWRIAYTSLEGSNVPQDSPMLGRQLRAMGAAHLQTVTALVGDHAALQLSPLESASTAHSMLSVLRWCPHAALLLSEPLQQCFCALLRNSATPGDPHASVADSTSILYELHPSGTVGALLLERGALDGLLNALADSAATQAAAEQCKKVSLWAALLVSLLTSILRVVAHLPASTRVQQRQADTAALQAAIDQSGIPTVGSLAPQLRVSAQAVRCLQHDAVPPARRLAAALLDWHRQPEQVASVRLELARAAAARGCGYLLCANVGLEGGPAAGEGYGCKRCSSCRATWYCGTACSHADWRAGHRKVCKQLAEERQQERQQAAAACGGLAGNRECE